MRISDWSSDVCSSDLRSHRSPPPPRRRCERCGPRTCRLPLPSPWDRDLTNTAVCHHPSPVLDRAVKSSSGEGGGGDLPGGGVERALEGADGAAAQVEQPSVAAVDPDHGGFG